MGKLEDYPWSSYPAYIGVKSCPNWLYRDQIYGMLGRKQRYAGYRAYMEAGIDEEIKHYYSKGNMAAILGGRTFRESVYKALRLKPEPQQIVSAVSDVFNIGEEYVLARRAGKRVRNDDIFLDCMLKLLPVMGTALFQVPSVSERICQNF